MLSQQVTIVTKPGRHARAAAKLVKTASAFAAQVTLDKAGQVINGKSIMGVMMLAAAKCTTLELCAEGSDAEDALQKLEALVAQRFDEEE